MSSHTRPEHIAPPELFYGKEESEKYARNSRIIGIQRKLSERAVELLNMPSRGNPGYSPKYLLDIGCGSGLSGDVLTEAGHRWVGIDISEHMLDIAREREVEGDVFLQDMGRGLSFRPGVFDGAISISALQWLCNADSKDNVPKRRLTRFFTSLYRCLARGARAVFQFYPENPAQMELITTCAMRSGFSGGLVVDYPHSTKAKKYFLCLFAGVPQQQAKLPKGKTGVADDDDDGVKSVAYSTTTTTTNKSGFGNNKHNNNKKNKKKRGGKQRSGVKDRNWVLEKKAKQRAQGKKVRPDTKYTGRRRRGAF